MPKKVGSHQSWSEEEVDRAVRSYFKMFRQELEEENYTKADYQKEVARNTSRSEGAAGLKFQQISTVLDEGGYEHLYGYTPRDNYQKLVKDYVQEFLDENPDLRSELRRPQIVEEIQRRQAIWEELRESGGPDGVESTLVRELNIYRGQAGIWRDKERTAELTEEGNGVTVSVLHTGQSYADDLSEGGVIYHYPDTDRIGSRDGNEVEATKNACRLEIPIFVVVYAGEDNSKRDVYLGQVVEWNDETEEFLILFDEDVDTLDETVAEVRNREQEPFQLTSERSGKHYPRRSRPKQKSFEFKVFKRYGKKCAVCEIDIGDILIAAHIRGKAESGSDDARNGLVLCENHHTAFDSGLFGIEPETLRIHTRDEGPSKQELRIDHSKLSPAKNQKPHEKSLRWKWKRWKED